MKTLLLGMGNPILSDDSIGIRLAHDIGGRLGGIPDLQIVEECSVGGLNLLDRVTGYQRLIVLDSIKTAGGVAGSWYRFTASSLQETMNLRNIHDTNFATALELGRRMGMPLPADQDIHVFAVEIKDNANFGESLSGDLERVYAEILAEILGEVRTLAAGPP